MEQIVHVSGMTCDHCVSAVTSEIGEIDGVTGVDVELHSGGVSHVTVHSDAPVPPEQISDAVDEAGFEIVAES